MMDDTCHRELRNARGGLCSAGEKRVAWRFSTVSHMHAKKKLARNPHLESGPVHFLAPKRTSLLLAVVRGRNNRR